MKIRRKTEKIEEQVLSFYGTKSNKSKGRKKNEPQCAVRTDFQRDRDRLIHSKAFRRLKHKTQVFISPEGDHYRTRLSHTLEVSQIARTAARALRLNEDLVEAISIGHDLGHTPFGHAGEEILNRIYNEGFKHNYQSLRVIDKLEKGQGLNLTYEVRDGILNHTGNKDPETLEGQLVKISDRIAYINHDIDDALRARIIKMKDIPTDIINVLGDNHSKRINRMVTDLINTSLNKHIITMSKEIKEKTEKLRDFMFENVYIGSNAKSQEEKANYLLEQLYCYYLENPDELPNDIKAICKDDYERGIVDFISGMTDRYAISVYKKIFIPTEWPLFDKW